MLCFVINSSGLWRKALQNTIGVDRMASISPTHLLVEIKRAAVVKQTDVLYKVRLIEAMQEPDEPIRAFVARLRLLA